MADTNQLIKILGVGIPAVFSCYFLYNYLTSSQTAAVSQPYQFSEINEEQITKVVTELRQIMTDQPLRQQQDLIEKVYRESVNLVKHEYSGLTSYYRKKRRSLKTPADVVGCILEYEAKVKDLKDVSLNSVLARLDISEDVWNDEVLDWIAERDQQWKQLVEDMQTELQKSIPSAPGKRPSKQQLHKIFSDHVTCLQSFDIDLYKLRQLKYEDVLGVVNHLVEDELYRKHKVEKEDIQQALDQLGEEEYEQFTQYFDQITGLMSGLLLQEDV